MLTVWMLGAPCPPPFPQMPAGPDSSWVSAERAELAVERLRLAAAASSAGECEVALAALGRWRGACEGPACARGAEQAAQIEAGCLVDAADVAVPRGGRVIADVEAPPGRLVVGQRMLTYVLADGRRFARPLCVRRGVPPEVVFDALDASFAPLEGDQEARVSALAALAREYTRREAWCETATLYDALAELTDLPAARYNAAVAHAEREGGCGDAGPGFEALIAAAPSEHMVESARLRLERLRERCESSLLVVDVAPEGVDVVQVGVSVDGAHEGVSVDGAHEGVSVDGAHEGVSVDAMPPRRSGELGKAGTRCRRGAISISGLWPGVRRIELRGGGRSPVVTWVPLWAGRNSNTLAPAGWWSRDAPPPSPPEETLGWLWAPVAATGLGLTAGVVFTVLAERDLDAHAQAARDAQRDPSRSYLADQRAALDDFDRDRAIAYVGWGLAAAGAAVFAVGWALDDVEGEVVATGDGLRVEGRF